MFNLLQLFKGKDFLTSIQDDFGIMLNTAETMFDRVCKSKFENQGGITREEIDSYDKEIDKIEKSIRKRILEHLSFNPAEDVSLSLILMSIVKDAERVGDYCQSLYGVIDYLGKPVDKAAYPELFAIEGDIRKMFSNTKEAFLNSNEERAKICWEAKKEVAEKVHTIISDLAKGSKPANEAVSFVLVARCFKRIASHLTNVATAMVVPLSDLDHYGDKK